MLSEHQRLTEQIKVFEKQISELPEGKLVIAGNGEYNKWYLSDGHHKTYIPKNQQDFAEKLAVKKYLTALLNDAIHEKKAIEFYLNHHLSETVEAEKLFASSAFQKLLLPHFTPLSKELDEWQKAPYEHNSKHPEHLIHKSSSGLLVRSKSEAIIATLLEIYRIPFRYECALSLGTSLLFPDFTIRHPFTGETYLWEHFGMMDTPSYAQNTCAKLDLYTSHNIIPSINLITTYETQASPLSPEMVKQLIEYYFT